MIAFPLGLVHGLPGIVTIMIRYRSLVARHNDPPDSSAGDIITVFGSWCVSAADVLYLCRANYHSCREKSSSTFPPRTSRTRTSCLRALLQSSSSSSGKTRTTLAGQRYTIQLDCIAKFATYSVGRNLFRPLSTNDYYSDFYKSRKLPLGPFSGGGQTSRSTACSFSSATSLHVRGFVVLA